MSLRNSLNDFAANWGPRSDPILSGNPYRLKRLLRISLAMSSAVAVLFVGMNITPLLRPWSTMVRIESYPLDVGRSVTISMTTYPNGRSLPSIGIREIL